MNPGNLNSRIEIVKEDKISDGSGGYEIGFTPLRTVWGNIKSVGGRERILAMQAQAEITHKITIRYTEDLKKSHLISFNKNLYDIQYIVNIDEENKFLEISVLRRD